MNNPKEAIKLARRLYESGKTRTARALLREYGLADRYVSVGDSITRLEQEYGILDEVLTDSELDKHFRDRCKSHEMRDSGKALAITGGIDPELAGIDMEDEELTAEDYGCMDIDGNKEPVTAWELFWILIGTLLLVGAVLGLVMGVLVTLAGIIVPSVLAGGLWTLAISVLMVFVAVALIYAMTNE